MFQLNVKKMLMTGIAEKLLNLFRTGRIGHYILDHLPGKIQWYEYFMDPHGAPCITESFREDGLKYNVQYGQYGKD